MAHSQANRKRSPQLRIALALERIAAWVEAPDEPDQELLQFMKMTADRMDRESAMAQQHREECRRWHQQVMGQASDEDPDKSVN